MNRRDSAKPQHRETRPERASWSDVVLLCGKCLRRQDREELRGELRKALKRAGHRDLRVALVGCLDLCPKGGITTAMGADLGARPPRLHVFDGRGSVEALAEWVLSESR